MGQAISKGNEMKSKMKQPSEMPTPRFEQWSNTLLLDHGGNHTVDEVMSSTVPHPNKIKQSYDLFPFHYFVIISN